MIAQLFPRNAVTLACLGCGRAAAAAIAGVKRMAQIMRHRREAAMLASFNARMLADIGLTRGDVNDAFAEPLWRDPTAVLAARARERRVFRRGIWPPRPRQLRTAPSILPSDDVMETDPGADDMRAKRARAA